VRGYNADATRADQAIADAGIVPAGRSLNVAAHVAVRAAAFMRAEGITDAVLVINKSSGVSTFLDFYFALGSDDVVARLYLDVRLAHDTENAAETRMPPESFITVAELRAAVTQWVVGAVLPPRRCGGPKCRTCAGSDPSCLVKPAERRPVR